MVARRYADFLLAIADGSEFARQSGSGSLRAPLCSSSSEAHSAALPDIPPEAPAVPEDYVVGWSPANSGAREYVQTHLTRLSKTLAITPPGGPGDRVLEMGAYLQITPALKSKLGYGEVRGCYYGQLGETSQRTVRSEEGEEFTCVLDLFNAEKDRFPYPAGHFSTVLCCELIEHLFEDPMHLMSEINRILKPGGHLVLTTPNIASLRAIAAVLQGYHPGLFQAYIRPSQSGEVDARHNREYTPREISDLLVNSGFEVTLLETGPFREEPKPELAWVVHLLERYLLSTELRGDGIYAVGRKPGQFASVIPGGCTVESMTARYQSLDANEADGSRLRVRFKLQNRSRRTWRRAGGPSLGWQIYDPANATFIAEGEWMPLPHDLAPGDFADVEVPISLPAETGPYRVYVSLIDTLRGWFYAAGEPFVLIEAAVAGGHVRLVRARVTKLARVRWENFLEAVPKAFRVSAPHGVGEPPA